MTNFGNRTKPGEGSLFGGRSLTVAMNDLLWVIAQHKYGWAYCPKGFGSSGRYRTAKALERRGLVTIDETHADPYCSATAAGRAEIERIFPVSPFALGTYDHQAGGWTPRHA